MRILVAVLTCIALLSDCRRTERPRHEVYRSDSAIHKEKDTQDSSVIDEQDKTSDRYFKKALASLLFASNSPARQVRTTRQHAGVSERPPRSARLGMMEKRKKGIKLDQALIDALHLPKDPLQYLSDERPELLGKADSHQLIEADHDHDVLTFKGNVPDSGNRFLFVDEAACIGCTGCQHIARSTFMMDEDFGKARVMQQLADDPDIIEETLSFCPVDCIHRVCFNELKALEKARAQGLQDGSHAATQLGSHSLRAEGRVSHWKDSTAGEGSEPSIFDQFVDLSNDELERAKTAEAAIDALMNAEMFADDEGVGAEGANAVVGEPAENDATDAVMKLYAADEEDFSVSVDQSEEDDVAIRELLSHEYIPFSTVDDLPEASDAIQDKEVMDTAWFSALYPENLASQMPRGQTPVAKSSGPAPKWV